MKSAFGTLICFLVLGFFLMASVNRTQAEQRALPPFAASVPYTQEVGGDVIAR